MTATNAAAISQRRFIVSPFPCRRTGPAESTLVAPRSRAIETAARVAAGKAEVLCRGRLVWCARLAGAHGTLLLSWAVAKARVAARTLCAPIPPDAAPV